MSPRPLVLDDIELPFPDRRVGKVRRSWALSAVDGEARRLFVTTDRISAFDRVLGCIPCKGQVLNQLAAWWFAETVDVVGNHVVSVPDPNVLIARDVMPLPVEVIVRGRITGSTSTSLWTRYAAGQRLIDGHTLPDGLAKHASLTAPIITPTTKPTDGSHDEPLSETDVVQRGLVSASVWDEVRTAALGLFARASAVGERAGLVLADTKFEFGLDRDGNVLLIDEALTPDSSRWWEASSLGERLAAGHEPESLDKEPLRLWLVEQGYRGDGPAPSLDDGVVASTSARYVRAFERITGSQFVPGGQPIDERIRRAVASLEVPS
jgi:phosphoribosylaminoimidazole-succinocarboxamide synthase